MFSWQITKINPVKVIKITTIKTKIKIKLIKNMSKCTYNLKKMKMYKNKMLLLKNNNIDNFSCHNTKLMTYYYNKYIVNNII